ncbi:MAG TPA: ThuA domain-containing protein [Vicinamibacterales bacterium]|nr:ThuA domain-containing protein [Vicinamibacterales bacterium]
MTRHAWPLLVLTFLSGCGGSPPSQSNTPPASPTPAAPSVAPVRVLMITATAAFRHDSIPTARSVVSSLASRTGTFTVTATETLTDVSASRLASTDVLMFALTTGELAFDDTQKAAIVSFVDRGGGFIGVHSATDTLYQWPDYGRLVGAYFKEHPWTQTASVVVEDRSHPAAAGVESPFRLLDEFYTFQRNPRGSVAVLLSLDPRSVNADGDFPLAWTQSFGRGRSYYNALGHFDSTWNDPWFQRQLAAAILWTAGR